MFEMITVQSAKLEGPGGEFELSSLRVTLALGDIGSASATLALGQQLGSGTRKSLDLRGTSFNETWTITVETGSTGSRKVFTGYLMGIKEERTPSVTGTRMTVVLVFSGLASKLRTINASSFRQWGSTNSYTRNTMTPPGEPLVLEGTALDGLWNTALEHCEPQVDKPTEDMVQYILTGLAAIHKVSSDMPSAEEIIKECVVADKPAKLADIILDNDSTEGAIHEELGELLKSSYMGMDLLSCIQNVGQNFYLSVVPRSDGKIRIMPVLAWRKTEDESIDLDTIVGCSRTGSFDNAYQNADHVAVALPAEAEESDLPDYYATWPVTLTDKPGKAKIISLPSWLVNRMRDVHDLSLQKDMDEDGGRVKDAKEGNSAKRIQANKDIGALVAKAGFAAACGAQEAFDVFVRWDKLDYLDKVGYIVRMPQMHDPNTETSEYIGMISGVTLSMDVNPQGGRCALALTVVSARTTEANNELGLDEHPIYQE